MIGRMSPDDPKVTLAIREASARVETLHAELLAVYPALRGNLAIPGMLVGYGLGAFVANGLPDDQIVTHVLTIVAQIRQALSKVQSEADSPDDDATVH